MRTIVDIPDKDIAELRRIQKKESVSRAELIRRAVADLVRGRRQSELAARPGFGLWRTHNEDGVSYQERVRSEWDR